MGSNLKNIYLIISQGCNISCSYCYAKGGDFGKGQLLMNNTIMQKTLERLLPMFENRCTISFFGGEPLLNFELMKETVVYGKKLAKEKDIDLIYSITTNGTILNEDIISFFKEYITYAAVSIDGGPIVNDTHRLHKDGNGTHAIIIKNLRKLKGAGIPFGIGATVSPKTVHNFKETVKYLSGIGARNLRVVPVIPQNNMGWEGDVFKLLLQEFRDINMDSIHMVFKGKKPLLAEHLYKIISNVAGSIKRYHPCTAGEGILAVAANGDVYPCDHFIGIERFFMGNVFEKDFPGERFYKIKEVISNNSIEQRERCQECRVKYICGGECHARSFMLTGDISTPSPDHCALIKGLAKDIVPIVLAGLKLKDKKERLFKFIGKPSSDWESKKLEI